MKQKIIFEEIKKVNNGQEGITVETYMCVLV